MALVIHEDDASFLLRGYCTDKGSHTSWHRMKRNTCDQKLFHLPWKEREKDKNKSEIHSPPHTIFLFSNIPILLLSFPLSSTDSLSLPPLPHVSFLLVVVFLPPSLPYSRFSSFCSFYLIFFFLPVHLMSMPSLKRHSSFPHFVELKVVSRSSCAEQQHLSHHQGRTGNLEGLHSTARHR